MEDKARFCLSPEVSCPSVTEHVDPKKVATTLNLKWMVLLYPNTLGRHRSSLTWNSSLK